MSHYTVRDLKKILAQLPDDLELVYAADSEGNEFGYVQSLPGIVWVRDIPNNINDLVEIIDDQPKGTTKDNKGKTVKKCVIIN